MVRVYLTVNIKEYMNNLLCDTGKQDYEMSSK